MDPSQQKELAFRLSEAGGEELVRLIDEHLDELDPVTARQAFRNPFLSGDLIERLVEAPALRAAYEVRSEAARHPRSPRLLALRLVPGLYWSDLVRVGTDPRLHPLVRRAADLRLGERLPGLSVGEKMAIGRSASRAVLAVLRNDPSPRIMAALLENPRLTEGVLAPLVASENASPQVLGVIAASARWGVRYPIRVALCRNPQTPLASILPLLPMLKKPDLEAVAADPRAKLPVRRRAELLARGGGSRTTSRD